MILHGQADPRPAGPHAGDWVYDPRPRRARLGHILAVDNLGPFGNGFTHVSWHTGIVTRIRTRGFRPLAGYNGHRSGYWYWPPTPTDGGTTSDLRGVVTWTAQRGDHTAAAAIAAYLTAKGIWRG